MRSNVSFEVGPIVLPTNERLGHAAKVLQGIGRKRFTSYDVSGAACGVGTLIMRSRCMEYEGTVKRVPWRKAQNGDGRQKWL